MTAIGETPTKRTTAMPVAGALKDAVLAALVALGLFGLMVGLHAVQGPTGQLTVTTRLDTLAILVGVTFAGAFARALLFGPEPIVPAGRFAAPLMQL
jgi:branched-chain amino acid transport system permease protein